jgi:TRAP-type C4-dicarboxylate transport system permease small subunit
MTASSLPRAGSNAAFMSVVVKGVDNVIAASAILLAVTALGIMFLSLMAEVAVRYLTNQGMGWPSEMPNILFPWLVMSGVVLAAQRGQHIAVTVLLGFLARPAARVLLLLLQMLLAATFFYLVWLGLDVVAITGSEVYPVTGLSARWAYLALIAGFAGLGITALTTSVRLLLASDPLDVRAQQSPE